MKYSKQKQNEGNSAKFSKNWRGVPKILKNPGGIFGNFRSQVSILALPSCPPLYFTESFVNHITYL